MAKRFTDTDKWKKPLLRSMQAPYKLLWLYINDDCNHAGLWPVDLDVAAIRIGEKLNVEDAVRELGDLIHVLENGATWFLPSFIDFQYGALSIDNRVHKSVIELLSKYPEFSKNKQLTSPLEGAKDKDKDKDKSKGGGVGEVRFSTPIQDEITQFFLEYCEGSNWNESKSKSEAVAFFNFYEAKGWMVGKNKMKDWKASVRGWVGRGKDFVKSEQRVPNPEQYDGYNSLMHNSDAYRKKLITENGQQVWSYTGAVVL